VWNEVLKLRVGIMAVIKYLLVVQESGDIS
jgi:hypothetical protein